MLSVRETPSLSLSAALEIFGLVGGDSASEGRVEICIGEFWGTVCDSRWGQKEALVVCRQSEFGESGKCISYTAIYVVAGSLWGSYDVYSYRTSYIELQEPHPILVPTLVKAVVQFLAISIVPLAKNQTFQSVAWVRWGKSTVIMAGMLQ